MPKVTKDGPLLTIDRSYFFVLRVLIQYKFRIEKDKILFGLK